MIDLRSDTATQPTEGMRRAIAGAHVGDEQKREDPSVNELQERVAELLGQERAIFLPTATMANQIALKLHGRPGDVLIAERHSHVVVYEFGGAAVHAGLLTVGLPGTDGRLTAEQVHAATSTAEDVVDAILVERHHDRCHPAVFRHQVAAHQRVVERGAPDLRRLCIRVERRIHQRRDSEAALVVGGCGQRSDAVRGCEALNAFDAVELLDLARDAVDICEPSRCKQ